MKSVTASLKAKMLLLSILPLIIVTVAITMISLNQAHILSEQEIETFEENLLNSKHQELQHYVALAMNAIEEVVNESEPGDENAEKRIKDMLNTLTFGDDGYFFLYDMQGINLVHPTQPELVGQDLIELQDSNGKYVIRDLIRIADEGGGFYRYLWRKPSAGHQEKKLSFVVKIPKFNWMMGTGLYIDDIAEEVAHTRLKVTRNIRNTFFTVVVILAGTIIIITLIGIAINMHSSQLADVRLRELAHRYVQFQVSQRRNFARELHDGINQLMVSVKFRLELARDKSLKGDESAVDDITKGCDVLNMAIQEVRRISHDLRPIQLDDLGLESALHSMANDFSERTNIRMNARIELPEQRLPDDIEITLYRIAQETLTNIEKHAQAQNVGLKIWFREGYIWLEVSDDGRGFIPEKTETGIGLLNMRERTELLSGRFSIKSRLGVGTRIKVGFAIFQEIQTLMPNDNKIRVLLVDDHPLVLDGISARLEGEPSLEIIGMANDGKQALALASTLHPDVVLMDISMPVMNGFEASERFHAEQPDVKVLILSMHDDREYIVKLIKCGAAGYVLKDVSSNELISAIETVYGGGTYFSSGASQSLFSQFDQEGGHANTQQEELTGREKDVLKLVAEGNSNKEIARELDISVRTVETHRQNIKQKLDIHTAAGLTRYAIEHKLVD